MHCDRRRFICKTLHATLGASVASAFGNLQLVQAAARANLTYSFADYKALVCVFLYGGNDAFNMIVPVDREHYTLYHQVRPAIALAQDRPLALNAPATGAGSPGDGGHYGFHPSMLELTDLFNQAASPLAVVANVGTLINPVTKAQYQNGNVPLPPQLFSHADQLAYWQSSPPSNTPITGWGGRICDLLASTNSSDVPMLTSLSGEDAFIRGQTRNSYIMKASGASTLELPDKSDAPLERTIDALFASGTQAHVMERRYAAQINHSTATASLIESALDAKGTPDLRSLFPGELSESDLDRQLCSVAKLIWAANNHVSGYTGQKRQVFFVSTGTFDTHDKQLDNQPRLLALLSKSLSSFYKALQSVGLERTTTAFTASDFGRTLSSNGDGTDHGWGSHHLVIGGEVAGGRFYGDNLEGSGIAAMPSLELSERNPNDAGYGQIIPTTSVDQYTATLATWFGLSASDTDLIFPNLRNFSARNLGFL